MRVLVLGGTGLISTAIVQRLLDTNHQPILFNRGQTSARFQGDVETITGDRQDLDAFAQTIAGVEADAVIDMITFTPETAANAVEVFTGRVEHYLFCSTVCVYGGPLSNVPAEEDEPHTTVSDYGEGKSQSEAVFTNAHQASGFPVTFFRPSHCYGPGQPLLDIWGYNPCLVNRIREGLPILVPGDGFGLWQPGYIDDMAKGFVGALGRDVTKGKAYNIVGDEIMDWRTFHERMARAIGCEANIITMTTPQLVAGSGEGDASMLDEIFQYHAAYTNHALKTDVPEFTDLLPWEEGVRRTVAWMDENDVHRPASEQPWLDALAKRAMDFEKTLA
jgi:nucleoside-diphosphate-sugar epimerase